MRISKIFLAALLTFGSAAGMGQKKNGSETKMLREVRGRYKKKAEYKVLCDVFGGTDTQKKGYRIVEGRGGGK